MTASKKLIQAAAGVGGGAFYPYTVDFSFRQDKSSSARLSRTFSGTNRKTFTISFWIKLCETSTYWWPILSVGSYSSGSYFAHTAVSSYGYIFRDNLPSATVDMRPLPIYRDTSAWQHNVIAVDTTQATTANRFRWYINGEEITSWQTAVYPSLNYNFTFGSGTNYLGFADSSFGLGTTYGHNYFSQFAWIVGQQLTADDFGEFKNGVWVPKDITGLTYGTDSQLLAFQDSANLGDDTSGLGNDWTPLNVTSSDQMIDTPTHNNVTWLPTYQFGGTYYKSSGTLSDGNLTASVNTSSQIGIASTVLPSTGKWYWEIEVDTVAAMGIGMTNTRYLNDILNNQTLHYNSGGSGNSVYIEGSVVTTYGTSWTTGDVIGVYFNADDGEISWYKNGTAMDSSPYSLSYTDGWIPYIAQLSGAGTCVGTLVTDENKFNHTPPTDALALSVVNFPEPTLGPNSAENVTDYFAPILYTGNGTAIGSGGKAVTGLGFQPDFTWIKNRDAADNHMLFDAVRGVTKYISSNSTNAEATDTESLSTFDTGGFTLGNNVAVNTNTEDYVAWNWKGNGAGSSNTDGSITSTVSVNTDAGISIAAFTMPASGNFTVGHGLGVAPEMFILKRRGNTSSWGVWHEGLTGGTYYLLLNSTAAQVNDSTVWTSAPTSTLLNIGSAWPSGGQTAVAYSFAEVEGFSSFGSYTGNGSADGPFVYTGFRPAWILIKRTDGGTNGWNLYDTKRDTYNVADAYIQPNTSGAEGTFTTVDILSNGFKIRSTNSAYNTSSATYIYMAFAEMPFKYSNAR